MSKIATVYREEMAFQGVLAGRTTKNVRFVAGAATLDVTHDWWTEAGFPTSISVAVEVEE